VVASVLEFVTFFQLVVPITKRSISILPASERSNMVIISAYYGVPGALQIYGVQVSFPMS